MPKIKAEPVPFNVIRPMLTELLELIDRFENGETASKYRAEKLLLRYRKLMHDLGKKIIGAKVHALKMEYSLIPKKEADMIDATIVESEQKVELPE